MNQETFIRGIQLLNSILSENQQIKGSTIDTYFLILKDFNSQEYIDAIMDILKKEDLRYGAPSPAVIIKYINKHSKKEDKALEIFDYIKRDILLYGSKMPKYKQNIIAAINEIGGWNKLRNATDYEIKELQSKFVDSFNQSDSLALESKPIKKLS